MDNAGACHVFRKDATTTTIFGTGNTLAVNQPILFGIALTAPQTALWVDRQGRRLNQPYFTLVATLPIVAGIAQSILGKLVLRLAGFDLFGNSRTSFGCTSSKHGADKSSNNQNILNSHFDLPDQWIFLKVHRV